MQAQCGPIIFSGRVMGGRSMESQVAVRVGVLFELDFESCNICYDSL